MKLAARYSTAQKTTGLVAVIHTLIVVVLSALGAFFYWPVGRVAVSIRDVLDFAVTPLVAWILREVGPFVLKGPVIPGIGAKGTMFICDSVLFSVLGGAFYVVLTYVATRLAARVKRPAPGG